MKWKICLSQQQKIAAYLLEEYGELEDEEIAKRVPLGGLPRPRRNQRKLGLVWHQDGKVTTTDQQIIRISKLVKRLPASIEGDPIVKTEAGGETYTSYYQIGSKMWRLTDKGYCEDEPKILAERKFLGSSFIVD